MGQRIEIEMTTWEMYLLDMCNLETERFNQRKMLKMLRAMSNSLHPFFAAHEGEECCARESYEMVLRGKWPVECPFVVIGPPLLRKLRRFRLPDSPYCIAGMNAGRVLLRNSRSEKEIPEQYYL